ncbi:AtpZ/AtpI family protein [Rubrivirga sp. S365]|uniref:AtpZ/AtpI family protein n=1 Tax=Rubrivirga litoralis TaxID=3075598 RepID=A0ABU3BM84_9BACT|nr:MULTISPECIES: AtpZ/AtpI family protein [unclassified Rubrivirga]MDT0630398.1 AtpZ/AtpI family protein [Rubrivirga sp. F394]MDT7855909.1 AtpZ/AtpI family protein [Rubrivirga sp. S365]
MATPPNDPYADKPDRWERDDRAWKAKWADKEPEDEGYAAPPSDAYRPAAATPGTVHDAYGEGMRGAGPYLGLGAQIGGSMALFVGLGVLADRWLGTSPWGVVAGAALGMVGVVFLVLRIAREASK